MNGNSANVARLGTTKKLGFMKRASIIPMLCVAVAIASPAQTFTTLHSFDGTDGASPNALVQGTDGNFYGTTGNGGPSTSVLPMTADPDVARSFRSHQQAC
jgi:hypothetical protein